MKALFAEWKKNTNVAGSPVSNAPPRDIAPALHRAGRSLQAPSQHHVKTGAGFSRNIFIRLAAGRRANSKT
jgi:hypothetical protein